MACSCATGSPFGQAAVMGVPLSAVVEMADLEDGVNTITAYGADGFGQPLPLRYALEKNALLAYQVNGQELEAATGSSLQLWMPETVARYFTRDIVNIELTQEDAEPDVQQVDPCYRNKINIMNYADGCTFVAGDEITFEGVADDLGSPIEAIEFSFDGGATWTSCATEGATADKWVNWQFSTSFEDAGDYRMTVRAKLQTAWFRRLRRRCCSRSRKRAYRRARNPGAPSFSGVRLQFGNGFMGRVKAGV